MADEEHNEISPGNPEEEYHFSDENPDYDIAPPEANAAAPAGKRFSTLFQDKRRILIGGFIFLILVGVVYRIIFPADSTTVSAEIVQPAPLANPTGNSVPPAQNTVSPPPIQGATLQPVTAPSATAQPPTPVAASAPIPPAPLSDVPSPPSQVASGDTLSTLANRLTGLEQQNIAIVNTLQTKYTQKIADLESENNQLRQALADFKTQLNEVTTAFHQLSLLLQKEDANNEP